MARDRAALEIVENLEAGAIGEIHVQNDRVHPESLRGDQSVAGRLSGDTQETQLTRQIAEDRGEPQIVLHDENNPRVGRYPRAVVLHERWRELDGEGRLREIERWG